MSHARMSTRVTLTMFLPPPKQYASSAKSVDTGRWMRAPGATSAIPATVSPTARPSARRTHRLAASGRSEKYGGSRRSTSTKTTSVTVSTSTCVSARSGAPCSRNNPATE